MDEPGSLLRQILDLAFQHHWPPAVGKSDPGDRWADLALVRWLSVFDQAASRDRIDVAGGWYGLCEGQADIDH